MSSSDNRSNETMKDFPIVSGRTLILDDGLLHQLYFVALGERTGSLQLIRPRVAGRQSAVLTPRGLESIEVGGRSATAKHYSLVAGATDIQFWVDAAGRVLRVTIPTQGLTATREELPH